MSKLQRTMKVQDHIDAWALLLKQARDGGDLPIPELSVYLGLDSYEELQKYIDDGCQETEQKILKHFKS